MKIKIDEQTIHFWHLQLQLFEFPRKKLLNLYGMLYLSNMYIDNEFSLKINVIAYNSYMRDLTESEHRCIATHVALQLAGIEE